MFYPALAGLMAGNNTLDRGKPANCGTRHSSSNEQHPATKATTANDLPVFAGENHRKLERSPGNGNPPAFVTAQNALSGQTRGLLCILVRFLALSSLVTTTAHAFCAAPGPSISNFPRKQTWVASKSPPELVDGKYQIHGATGSEEDPGAFSIDEETEADNPALDLVMIEEDTSAMALLEVEHGAVLPPKVEIDSGDTLQLSNEYIGVCPRKIMDKLLLDHAISCNSHHIKDRPTIEPLTEGQAQHASSLIKLVSLAIFLATLCVVFHNTSLSAFKWRGMEQSKSSALPSAALKHGRKKHSNRNGRLARLLILLQGVVTSAQDNAIGCFLEYTVGGPGPNIAIVNNDPVETCLSLIHI